MKKAFLGIMAVLLLTSMLAFDIKQTKSSEPPEIEWSRTFGGTKDDYGESVVKTADGGYAVAGATLSFAVGGAGDWDFWLVKTDSAGNMLWNRTYGGMNIDYAYSMVYTSDGGYLLVGYTMSSGDGMRDYWLVKTDAFGNMEWNKTYGGRRDDTAVCVIQTSDGGYSIAGDTESFGAGSYDVWIIKTDSNGNMQWNKTYGGLDWDAGYSVVATCDGGFAIAGETGVYPSGMDVWLVKMDSGGKIEWDRTYGGNSHDYAWSLVQTSCNGCVLVGRTSSFGAGGWDLFLVNTDADGNMEWNQTFGGGQNDYGHSLVQTADGGYVLAGGAESFGAGGWDMWLIKLAPVEIPATIDIDPNTLNLKSKGRWITCYIELPEGYDVNDINVSTILLNDTVHAESHPTSIGDHDDDGIPDLMVKFDREEVISYIQSNLNTRERVCTVALTITGELYDGTQFQGRDSMRVLIFRKGDPIPR